jgi:hypothetical protein
LDKKIILGGAVGALTILLLTFVIFFGLISFSDGVTASPTNTVISVITILLAPIAGGLLAGLIGRSNPQKAALIAGLSASIIIFVAWLVLTGFAGSTFLSGLVIVFIWTVLARMTSGFVHPKMKP